MIAAHLLLSWSAEKWTPATDGWWGLSHRGGLVLGSGLVLSPTLATVATAALCALMGVHLRRTLPQGRLDLIGAALMMGGIAATLVDRIPDQTVTSYFAPSARVPFNAADVAILLGLVCWCLTNAAARFSPGAGRGRSESA